MGEPPFLFFPFSHTFFCGFFFFYLPSQISTEWAQNVESTTLNLLRWSSYIECNDGTGYKSTGNPSISQAMEPVKTRVNEH